nr:hypothetical protein [Tanacetum cinerariifolium]
MSDPLFDIYQNVESSKELLDYLEAKYMDDDASSKKFFKDFKRTLKHQKEELTLVELGSHLRIKESLRVHDNDKLKRNNADGPSVVKMIEHNNSIRYNDNKGKLKHQDTKADPNMLEVGETWTLKKRLQRWKSWQQSQWFRMMMLRGRLTQEQLCMCVKIDVGSRPISH